MNTAEDKYKKTIEQIKKKQEYELALAETAINEAVERGEFNCYVKGSFLPETIQKLKDNGYRVKI